MEQRRIERLCRTWQRRLRLQDWRTTVSICDAVPIEDSLGYTEYNVDEMEARIQVANGEDEIIEKTLIHELLHLRLSSLEVPDPHPPLEVAINLLSDALYSLAPKRK